MMFFNRNHRIKTEPRISGEHEERFLQSKRKIKIKNIRFSIDQQQRQGSKHNNIDSIVENSVEIERTNHKKVNFFNKLPEINTENKQVQRELGKEIMQVSVQHRKKDMLLNSILEILRPNVSQSENKKNDKPLAQPRMLRDWKIETSTKAYSNQFFEEIPHFNSSKHYRAPKILENEIMKYKNSQNIIRRKIFSEDKDRQRQERQFQDRKKPEGDLDKIEIVTFSNKFPGFRKDLISFKD